MMKKYIIVIVSVLFLSVLAFQSCGDEPSTTPFDKKAFLEHQAKNILLPNLNAFPASLATLQSNWDTYKESTNETALNTLRSQWKTTYLDWQRISMYNFGPGGIDGLTRSLMEEVGTFPVDATLIQERIQAEELDMNNYRRDARGILALDYLLFSDDIDLTDNKTQKYIEAVINKVIQRTTAVKNTWTESYLTEFINNDGTSVQSSTTLLFNEWQRSFTTLLYKKISEPMGLVAGLTSTRPHHVEAYYSRYSLEGAKAHFEAIENIWYGKAADGTDGIGWKEYLESVEGGKALAQKTEEKIQAARQACSNLPAGVSLHDLVQQENEKMKQFQSALKELVPLFKSDLSSVLSIAITFDHIDGD